MSHPVKGIDHCFALVQDLDLAARQYAALGFTLSPRGLHSEAKGSANYTIMFPDDYFELLGLLRETPGNASRRESLATMGRIMHQLRPTLENTCHQDPDESMRELASIALDRTNKSIE